MEIVAFQRRRHFLLNHPTLGHVHAGEDTENAQKQQRSVAASLKTSLCNLARIYLETLHGERSYSASAGKNETFELGTIISSQYFPQLEWEVHAVLLDSNACRRRSAATCTVHLHIAVGDNEKKASTGGEWCKI